ncbi:MAG: 30S ribosomal protein S8 [bacterium]
MSDPITAMFNSIKNGLNARHETVDVPYSKLKENVAKIFVSEGWLANAETMKRMNKQYLRLRLKYSGSKKGVITDIKRVSRPGRRMYNEVSEIGRVRGGFGTIILSTSKGLMTDQQARAAKVGGEVICQIW